MNYVEHHFGDYAKDTGHLSMTEHGAYRMLLDLYYVREAPLPAAVAECCRLVRAASAAERRAVETVLREFFQPTDGGWRHRRCDREIARYADKQAKAKRSAEARWSRSGNDATAMRTHTEGIANNDANALPPQSEGNAPKHQAPNTKHQTPSESKVIQIPGQGPPHALLARALVAAGIAVNPSSPRLIALAEAGCPVSTVEAAIAEARRAKGDGERIAAGYVIAIVERWMNEPATSQPERAAEFAFELVALCESCHKRVHKRETERARAVA